MNLIRNSFEAGELGPGMNAKVTTRQYAHGCRTLENNVVVPGCGGAERRPGFEVIVTGLTPEVPEVPGYPGTYTLTYISEGGSSMYAIPLGDHTITGLDAEGVARDVGGGVTGLPFAGHPFAAGQTIKVHGTEHFDGNYTLESGTSADELQITHGYSEETFDGTETVLRTFGDRPINLGAMVRDSAGNIYYGTDYDADTGDCVRKVAPDGTEAALGLAWPVSVGAGSIVVALALTTDDAYLYVLLDNPDTIIKFNLATRTAEWYGSVTQSGYECAIDADGNAYVPRGSTCARYDASDGSVSSLTMMGTELFPLSVTQSLVYDAAVSDDLGIVAVGGDGYCLSSSSPEIVASMYNLAVRTFDDSAGDTMSVGDIYVSSPLKFTGRISKRCIAISGEYLYVLVPTDSPSPTIHKIHWDGANLTEVSSWAGPAHSCGLFFDPWKNLVVVNQYGLDVQEDVFWYYDTNGNLLGAVDKLPSILVAWDLYAHMKGDVVFDGSAPVPGTPGVAESTREIPPVEI